MSQAIYRASVNVCALVLCILGISLAASAARADVSQMNSATISGSVNDEGGKPVGGATVSLSGLKQDTTSTDTHGLFVFVGVPTGTYEIAVTSSHGAVRREVSVQGDTNVAIVYEAANGLKTIASVSTNARFNVTSASMTHVDPMQLAMQGQTSWRKVLEQIPGVVQSGSGNGLNATSTMPDSPLSPVFISINGGLPYETATLLDDMPLIGSGNGGVTGAGGGGGTDLSLYPLNGFSGADIVRGPGAGAPSIVDSIGGSFVLHMPGAVSANHYDFSVSNDAYGGWIVNGQAAMRWKKLSLTASYGFDNSPGPLVRQTPTALPAFNIQSIDGQGYSAYVPPCPVQLTCNFEGFLYAPGFSSNGPGIYGQLIGLVACCINSSTPWNSHSGSLALNYVVSPALTAQLSYAGQQSVGLAGNQLQYNLFQPPSGYSGAFEAGQYFFPQVGGGLFAFGVPSSAGSASSLVEEKITGRLGKGVLKIAALQNRAYNFQSTNDPTSETLRLYGAAYLCSDTAAPYACNSFDPTYTLTTFNGDAHTVSPLQSSQISRTGTNNRDALISYESPVGKLYAGASYVQSYYSNVYGIFQLSPFSITPTIFYTPSAISQTTRESRLFLGGNPSEKTTLDLSMYFVRASYHVPDPNDPNTATYYVAGTNFRYSDVSYNYAAPRLGFVWRPNPQIALRAAAGGGFAQAPLMDMVGSNSTFYCFFTNSYSKSTPNFNLQPEKSVAFDVGTDVRLHHDTTLSFDLFQANLTGQFYSYTAPDGTYNDGFNGTAPLFVTQFVNLAASRYQGLSIDISHAPARGFSWNLAGGLTRGYVVSVSPGFYSNEAFGAPPCDFTTGNNCVNLNVVPGVNFNGTYSAGAGGSTGGASVPYAQAHGTLGYTWNPGRSVGLSLTYYGNNNSYFRPPFVTVDGNVHYAVTNHVALTLNFWNVTGIYDGGIQHLGPNDFTSAPVLAGMPYALYGGEVGPRTVRFVLSSSF